MIPAGAAAIVPNVAGMEHGVNHIITVPADVPVMTTGAEAIVRKRPDQPVRITVIGLLRVMGPTADSALVIPAIPVRIVRRRNNGVDIEDRQKAGRRPRLLSLVFVGGLKNEFGRI